MLVGGTADQINQFDYATVHAVNGIGGVAGLVDHFAFLQMPDARQFTQRLEFHRTQGRAKGEEIPTRHRVVYSRSRAEHDLK